MRFAIKTCKDNIIDTDISSVNCVRHCPQTVFHINVLPYLYYFTSRRVFGHLEPGQTLRTGSDK